METVLESQSSRVRDFAGQGLLLSLLVQPLAICGMNIFVKPPYCAAALSRRFFAHMRIQKDALCVRAVQRFRQ